MIVALVVSLVLFGVAAFTVDLGNALARRVDLQGIADAAARAGADQLPDTSAARAAAIRSLCSQPPDQTGWDYSGCSFSPQSAPGLSGSPNAQITFSDDLGNGTGTFVATQIRVTPAPVRVAFNFGQAVGADGVRVSSAATARIATAAGVGVLPFALFKNEVTTVPAGSNGQFCVAQSIPSPPPLPSGSPPTPQGGSAGAFNVTMTLPTTTSLPFDSGNIIQLRSGNSTYRTVNGLTNPEIVMGGVSLTGVSFVSTRRFQTTAPVYQPGTVWVWAEADFGPDHLVSNAIQLTYSPTPTSPCNSSNALRGYLDIARAPDPGGGDRLRDNVAKGLTTRIRPWTAWPATHSLPTSGQECSALLPPADVFRTSPGSPSADVNCLTTRSNSLPGDVADGFFGTGGRMKQRCGGPTTTAHAPYGTTIDDTQLFATGSPLLAKGITPTQLKTNLKSGLLPPAGTPPVYWITSKIFTCPRFGIVPVIDPPPAGPVDGAEYPIVGYRYVWIDDDTADRGFIWSGTNLVGFRGYIIDPAILPPLASESLRTTTYQPESWPITYAGREQPLPKVVVLGPP